MKKALIVATVFKFLNFERHDMEILQEMGYELHIATNLCQAPWLADDGSLDDLPVTKHQIDFGRSPFSKSSFTAYRQIRKLLRQETFDLIHCHTPVAAAISRLAAIPARRRGAKILYTSHGFHFHKHSARRNWVLYYPIEYALAFATDMIITINREDESVIQNFPVKEKRYIPGIGVDVRRIYRMEPDVRALRKQFGIGADDFLVLSVGELSARKNHQVVIRALAKIKNPAVRYLICGEGTLRHDLEELAGRLGVADRVVFAGQQPHETVLQLGYAADLGAIPSLIEGLGLAGIETMAAGRPVVGSGVQGIGDYVIDGETGIRCDPKKPEEFAAAIERLSGDSALYQHCSAGAKKKALDFDTARSVELMRQNYSDLLS